MDRDCPHPPFSFPPHRAAEPFFGGTGLLGVALLEAPYFGGEEHAVCETCWGEGSGEECELEGDWINYGSGWVLCPDCKGTGQT